MEKKLYLVEAVSMFRMRYVVEATEKEHASDEVVASLGNVKEFSQHHMDENIVSVRELSRIEYLDLFDVDNAYLSSWSEEEKFNFVNKIDYEK
jgi:hypothetical protein